MGEAALDVLQGAFERDAMRGEEQVDVVGHQDEGVELIEAFATVVLQGVEQELRVAVDLEEAAALPCRRGDEEGAVACGSGRDGHGMAKLTSAAEAAGLCGGLAARLKSCPSEFVPQL